MPKALDLLGQKFGRLTVLSRAPNNRFLESQWSCRCECGEITVVRGSALTHNMTRSCGCLCAEVNARRMRHRRPQRLYANIHTSELLGDFDE